MNRKDLIALGVSLGLHALLLLIAYTTRAEPEPLPELGFIAVDFGPVQTGRPVRQAPVTRPAEQPQPERKVEPQPRRTPQPNRPVKLPEARPTPSEEKVTTPRTQTENPRQSTTPTPTQQQETGTSGDRRTAGGDTRGTAGAASGTQGEGNESARSSPFNIEGLNRTPLRTPLPRNTANAIFTHRVRIAVAPDGSVRVVSGNRGNPELEREARNALVRWKFNPLPANAPQVEQMGTVTFRFTVQ